MTKYVQRVSKNLKGRDYVVGDIHGHGHLLLDSLSAIGFSPENDRLFSVGDLVDRGPDSAHVVSLLKEPWFFAVKGNHEDMAIRWFDRKPGSDSCEMPTEGWDMDASGYAWNGGSWFLALDEPGQLQIINSIRHLPLAIELETDLGVLGIVHAEVPWDNWDSMTTAFGTHVPGKTSKLFKEAQEFIMWGRSKIQQVRGCDWISGVEAVATGHTPMRDPMIMDNQMYLDTMGWRPEKGGRFTILEASKIIQIVRDAHKAE